MATTQNDGPPGAADDEFLPESETSLAQLDAADFPLLDVYDDQPSSVGQARPDALATISAGERGPERDGRPGLPKVSRDGTIYLHDPDGRAPGLAAMLAATDNKRLTVAFPFNDLHQFWQERFARYSQTRLEVYGDATEMREIVLHGDNPPEHVVHLAGTPEYTRLRKTCKVSTSVYFALAIWDGVQPRIIFPDGLGLYRLRTTSRHSRRAMLGSLQTASTFTGGQLAGLPFELRLTYREVPDPSGTKRNIPVWSLLFRPPEQIALSTKTWGGLRDAAIAEGRVLASRPALAPPSAETWQLAQAEGDVVQEPSDADLAAMLAGDSPADATFWRNTWFGIVAHTILDQDPARAKFIERYTEGRTSSLAEYLKTATNADAEKMIRAAVDMLNKASAVGAPTNVPHVDHGTAKQRLTAEQSKRYEEIFGGDPQDFYPDPAPQPAPIQGQSVVDAESTLAEQAEADSELDAPEETSHGEHREHVLEPDPTPDVHEPTPMDDILDAFAAEIAETSDSDTPVTTVDDFMPPEETGPVEPPADADMREQTNQWLKEVQRLISEGHRSTRGKKATPEEQRATAKVLLETVQGDVQAASKLLGILTTGAPAATRSARTLTHAQATVVASLANRDEWLMCCDAALRFAVVP